jgi:hypothetical protein
MTGISNLRRMTWGGFYAIHLSLESNVHQYEIRPPAFRQYDRLLPGTSDRWRYSYRISCHTPSDGKSGI